MPETLEELKKQLAFVTKERERVSARNDELWRQTLEILEKGNAPGSPGELAALRHLASIAQDAATQFEDWIGSASTRNATIDSMYRLSRALAKAGYPSNSTRCLNWRGSLLRELNDAGFFFCEEKEAFVFDPEARKGPPYRTHGNAVGPTLKEVAVELLERRAGDIESPAGVASPSPAHDQHRKCASIIRRLMRHAEAELLEVSDDAAEAEIKLDLAHAGALLPAIERSATTATPEPVAPEEPVCGACGRPLAVTGWETDREHRCFSEISDTEAAKADCAKAKRDADELGRIIDAIGVEVDEEMLKRAMAKSARRPRPVPTTLDPRAAVAPKGGGG